MAHLALIAALLLLVAQRPAAIRPWDYGLYGSVREGGSLGAVDAGFGAGTSAACTCAQEEVLVCGADGVTYNSACEAACGGVSTQCGRPCPCSDSATAGTGHSYGIVGATDGTQDTPTPSCPPGTPQVSCFVDPCSIAPAPTCSNHPTAICKTDYCHSCMPRFFLSLEEPYTGVNLPERDVTAEC